MALTDAQKQLRNEARTAGKNALKAMESAERHATFARQHLMVEHHAPSASNYARVAGLQAMKAAHHAYTAHPELRALGAGK